MKGAWGAPNDLCSTDSKSCRSGGIHNQRDDSYFQISTLINSLQALLKFLDEDLQATIDLRSRISHLKLHRIAFDDLWHLFTPGELLLSRDQKQAYRLMHVTGGRRDIFEVDSKTPSAVKNLKTKLELNCVFIDFDGTDFGPATDEIQISPYSGTRNILALEVYPMAMLGGEASQRMEDRLVARGQKFVKLTGDGYKRYTGPSIKGKGFRSEVVRRS